MESESFRIGRMSNYYDVVNWFNVSKFNLALGHEHNHHTASLMSPYTQEMLESFREIRHEFRLRFVSSLHRII